MAAHPMPQSKLKTTIHSLWPKLLVIVAGFGLYGLAVTWLQGEFKSLVIGIGGGLVSIPLAFIFYEIWQEKSHRKLNNSVYEFAENQMRVSIRAVKSKLELLVGGAFAYFESGRFLVDDADVENLKIYVQEEEAENVEPDIDNLLDFERESIFEALVDGRYLAFQLTDLSLGEELNRLEGLLSNAFIMERLSDSQVRAIIHLIEVVKMLEAFLALHHDVFLKSSVKLHGFRTEIIQQGLSALIFDNPGTDESVTLDIKPAGEMQPSAEPLNAYVVNPDCYAALSDLVYDVVEGINGWKSVSDPVYMDHEAGRIGAL
jgi:hypothetical protein